ncbi:hypothetical protein D3C75_473690 [compost metagenome]
MVKYGSHGGYHGHFDRLDLISLRRYNRSFYYPEIVWYGYGSYMYKFYVQNSIAHNMAIVDGKNQEAIPARELNFYAGELMQVFSGEVNARWAHPPYGGMRYGPDEEFAQKALEEGRSLPVPEHPPAYGEITGWTEPVKQIRTTVVTDHYVLIRDSLSGETEHVYDCMYHILGFQGVEGKEVGHLPQLDTDYLSSGQFITDCRVFQVENDAIARFAADMGSVTDDTERISVTQTGWLRMNLHLLNEGDTQLIVGRTPLNKEIRKLVDYEVLADGKLVASGSTGAWILGAKTLDIPVEGASELEIRIKAKAFKTFLGQEPGLAATLFVTDAYVEEKSGLRTSLHECSLSCCNVWDSPAESVIIEGRTYHEPICINPIDSDQEAVLVIPVKHLQARILHFTLGANYPPTTAKYERKTVAIRQEGRKAEFITLIEPFEQDAMIRRAYLEEGQVVVELKNGSVQRIRFLKDATENVEFEQVKNGVRHQETTICLPKD